MPAQKTNSSQKEIAEIWKLFRETDRKMQTMSKAADKRGKKIDQRIKELNELFTGQWGKLMESLVRGDLIKLLRERNIKVNYILHSEERQGTYNERQWEVDIIAINGEEIVVVEVKTTLTVEHVNHFIKKLKQFTKWRPEYKNRKIYGAVAYLKTNQSSDVYSEKRGLFIIRATGSSASIANTKNFKPKTFS